MFTTKTDPAMLSEAKHLWPAREVLRFTRYDNTGPMIVVSILYRVSCHNKRDGPQLFQSIMQPLAGQLE